MAAPTTEELGLLIKFRHNLRDLNLTEFANTDLGLLQWLRARELKLDQAEAMLRKSLKWRAEHQMESILTWPAPQSFSTLCPVEYCGFDKENCPIIFLPFGSWNAKKLVNTGHSDDYVKYSTQFLEKLRAQGQGKFLPSGQPVTQCLILLDTKGLSLQTLACIGAINMFMDSLRAVEANYPETIKKIIVINASRIFTAFFNLVKPIMSQRTFGKIDIYNSNVETWMAALLENVAMNQLPKYLLKVRRNSIDPRSKSNERDHIVMNLGPGQKFPVNFDVEASKSILSWSFTTDQNEIGFGLTLGRGGTSEESLVPFGNVQSHEEAQEGVIVCEKAGNYKFVFSNTKNFNKAITLRYQIELIEPQ